MQNNPYRMGQPISAVGGKAVRSRIRASVPQAAVLGNMSFGGVMQVPAGFVQGPSGMQIMMPSNTMPQMMSMGQIPQITMPQMMSIGQISQNTMPQMMSMGQIPQNTMPQMMSMGQIPQNTMPQMMSMGQIPQNTMISMQIPINPGAGPIPQGGIYPLGMSAPGNIQMPAAPPPGPLQLPLDNIDPETAKGMLGQLMQVLQKSGQLPANASVQQLMQMSAGQSLSTTTAFPTDVIKLEDESDTETPAPAPTTKKKAPTTKKKAATPAALPKVAQMKVVRSHQETFINVDDGGNDVDWSLLPPVKVESKPLTSATYGGIQLGQCSVKLNQVKVKGGLLGRVVLPAGRGGRSINVKKMVKVTAGGKRRPAAASAAANEGERSAYLGGESVEVDLLANMNETRDQTVRTMYMGPAEGHLQWLTVVWWRNAHFFCQCVFCPLLAHTPRTVLEHLRDVHSELHFALNRKELLGKLFLFINCRHCDFVTVDPVVLWIHHDIYHGLAGILEGGLPSDPRLSVKVELARVPKEAAVAAPTSYACYDCFEASEDCGRLARHVFQEHKDSANVNGNFVKLILIKKPDDRPGVTYGEAIFDTELASARSDVYVCLLCDFSVNCPYGVLSHTLAAHESKRLVYACSACSYKDFDDAAMIQHMKSYHGMVVRFMCSAAIVEKSGKAGGGGGFAEIPVTVHRKKTMGLEPPPYIDIIEPAPGQRVDASGDEEEAAAPAPAGRQPRKRRRAAENGGRARKPATKKKVTIDRSQMENGDEDTEVEENGNDSSSVVLQSKRVTSSEVQVKEELADDYEDGLTNGGVDAAAGAEVKEEEEEAFEEDEPSPMSPVADEMDFQITLAEGEEEQEEDGTTVEPGSDHDRQGEEKGADGDPGVEGVGSGDPNPADVGGD